MKFKSKITMGLIAIFMAIVMVFTYVWYNPESVRASSNPGASGKVNIWYKTYAKDDYEIFDKWTGNKDDFSDDFLNWLAIFLEEKAPSSINGSYSDFKYTITSADSVAISKANAAWDDYDEIEPSSGNSNSCYVEYGDYPLDILGAKIEDGFTLTLNIDVRFKNSKYQIRNFSFKDCVTVTPVESTEFEPGDEFVFLVYMQATDLEGAELMYDRTFGGIVSSTYSITGIDSDVWSDQYSGAIFPDVNTSGTTSGSVKIGGFNANGVGSGEIFAGGLYLKVDDNASTGNYTIGVSQIIETVITASISPTANVNFSTYFAENKQTITIKSASVLDSISVSSASGYTIDNTVSVNKNGTITSGSDTFDLYEATDIYSAVSSTNFSINVTANAILGSTIIGMSQLKDNVTDAIGDVSGITATASYSNTLNATTWNFGATKYLAVQTRDTVKHILKIKRVAYTDCSLNSFTVSGNGIPATVNLLDSSGSSSATFSSTTTSYTLSFASDTTTLTFKPEILSSSANKGITAEIVNPKTTVNLGASNTYSISPVSPANSFTIRVYSQDTTVYKDYTFNLKPLSTDSTLTITNVSAGTASSTGTNEITISGIPYATSTVTFTAQNNSGATITDTSTSYTLKGSGTSSKSASFTVTPNGILKATGNVTTTLVVTSAAGGSTTYTIKYEREAADTESSLDLTKLTAKDDLNNNITLQLDPSDATGKTYISSADVNCLATSFTLSAEAKSKLAIVKIGSTGTSYSTSSNIGFGLVSSSAVTKTATVLVTSEAGGSYTTTYTVKVTRAAADDDADITYEVYGVDKNGNTIYGYDASDNAITTSSGFTTSFIKYYGFETNGFLISNTTEVKTSVKKIIIHAKTNSSTSSLTIDSTDQNDKDFIFQLTFTTSSSNYTGKSISVKTQANNTVVYYFRAYTERISTDSYINQITATGVTDSSVTYPKDFTTDRTDTTYTFLMEQAKNTQYNLSIVLNDSKSTVYYSTDLNDFTSSSKTPLQFTGTTMFSINPYSSSSRLYLYVVSENGGSNCTTYTVDVRFTDTRENNSKINDIKVYSVDQYSNQTLVFTTFNDAVATQDPVTVSYSTTSLRFVVTLDGIHSTLVGGVSTDNTISIHAITGNADTSKNYTVQAKAENGTLGTQYIIPITRKAAETGAAITSSTLNGAAPDITNSTNIVFHVARGVSNPQLNITVSSGATYSISALDGSSYTSTPLTVYGLTDGIANKLTVSVTSEKNRIDGLGSVAYTIYIIPADTNNVIDNIEISDSVNGGDLLDTSGNTYSFSSTDVSPITFNIAYGANNPEFVVTNTTTPNSTISGDIGAQTVNKSKTSTITKSFTITSTSEYGTILKSESFAVPSSEILSYTYKIVRDKASTVNTLDELEFIFSGSYTPFDENNDPVRTQYMTVADTNSIANGTLKFENLTNTSSVTINYKKTSTTATITGLSDSDPMASDGKGTSSEHLALASNTTSYVYITCTAEDGSTKKWTIAFAYSTVTLDNTATVTKMTLTGDVDTADILGFNQTTYAYNKHLSGKNSNAILIVTPTSALSTIEIDNNLYAAGNQYSKPLTPGSSVSISVKVTSQDKANSVSYTINVECDALKTDAALSNVTESKFNDSTWSAKASVQGFTATTYKYTIKVTNDISEIKLEPTLSDASATIVSNGADPTKKLSVGKNTVQIIVQAEDSSITNTYEFEIIKDDFIDLEKASLVDPSSSNEKISSFSSSNTSYSASVSYAVSSLNLSFQPKGSAANLKTTVTLENEVNGLTNKATIATSTRQDADGNDIFDATLPLEVGENKLVIELEATSGLSKAYTFTIKRAEGNTSNYIVKYVQEDQEESLGDYYQGKTIAATIDNQSILVLDSNETIKYVLPKTFVNKTFNPTVKVSEGSVINGDRPNGYSILESDEILKSGENKFTIEIESEVGDVRKYNVVVYVADSYEKSPDNLKIEDLTLIDTNQSGYIEYDETKASYDVSIPYSVKNATLTVYMKTSSSTVKVNGVTASNSNTGYYTHPLEINESMKVSVVVESEYYQYSKLASETRTIVINITKEAANTDTTLKTLTLECNGKSYELIYDENGTITTITPKENEIIVSGTDFTIANVGNEAQSFKITAATNKDYPLATISGASYNDDYTLASTSVQFLSTSNAQSHTITVYDEDGKNPRKYNILVYRGEPVAADDINTLSSLEVYDSKGEYYIGNDGYAFSDGQTLYTFDTAAISAIPYGLNKTYTIVAGLPVGATATVYIDGNQSSSKSKQVIITYPDDTNTNSYVVAEDEKQAAYYSFRIDSSVTANNYGNFYFYDANIQKYISAKLLQEYDSSLTYYRRNDVLASNVSSTNYYNYYVADADYVYIHEIYAMSHNGAKGKVYQIRVVAKAATIDATLERIMVDGTLIDNFDPKTTEYNLGTYDNTVESVTLFAKASDENAKVTITNTTTQVTEIFSDNAIDFNLEVGTNNFSILVTAEDGLTTKTYTIKVVRDYADPDLTNLVLEDEKFYDYSLQYELTFDKEITTYYSKVSYKTERVNITATLDESNSGYTVIASGGASVINNTGTDRAFSVYPNVGNNRYTLTVRSNVGKTKVYVINIKRSEEISSSTEISSVSLGGKTIDSNYDKLIETLRDSDNNPYLTLRNINTELLAANTGTTSFGRYLIPNSETSLDLSLVLSAHKQGYTNASYELINNTNLPIGNSTAILKITSDDKSQVETLLIDLYREPYSYNIKIDEFTFDQNNILSDGYVVSPDIEELHVDVVDNNENNVTKDTVFEVINGKPLAFGENDVTIQITSYRISDSGKSRVVDNVETLSFKVIRQEYEFDVNIKEISEFRDDFANDEITPKIAYELKDANIDKLTVEAYIKGTSTELDTNFIINNVITDVLSFGKNTVVMEVTLKGTEISKTVEFTVTRPAYDLTVAKTQRELSTEDIVLVSIDSENKITPITNDSENGVKIEESDKYLAEITVPSSITKVSAEVLDVAGMADSTVELITEEKLTAGKSNIVTFVIVSKDGTRSDEYKVEVYRNKMKYDVESPNSLYTLSKNVNREGYWNLELGDKPASVISDYTEFIKFENTENLEVEVLSDITSTSNEVILKITNKEDTSEVEYVHLLINTTASSTGSMFDLIFWVILGIAVILLIIILICVNRDKYGSVSKKRKHA